MAITLDKRQGLIAGDGLLPVKMAQYAKENGFEVVAISLSADNYKELKKHCSKVYSFCPGEVNAIEQALKAEEIKQLTFLGKVNKSVLLKRPKFDKRIQKIGTWRSLVAYYLGVVGVAGSNPVVPILNKIGLQVEPTVSKCILISTAQSSPRAKQNPVVPILNKSVSRLNLRLANAYLSLRLSIRQELSKILSFRF